MPVAGHRLCGLTINSPPSARLCRVPEAQPFLIEGSETAVLLLHGFTSTPQSVRHVGHSVHQGSGATVLVPVLAGHGAPPEALAATGQQDRVASAEVALGQPRTRCARVVVAGLSLGATLALNLAARRPDMVDGAVSINGSTGLYRPEVVLPLFEAEGPEFLPGIGSDIRDGDVRELCYDPVPHATLRERFLLTFATGALLPLIRQPCLVIQSREDDVVNPNNALRIVREIASDNVHLVWLTELPACGTLDHDRDRISQLIRGFMGDLGG